MIYPPTLQSTQPAFLYSSNACPIHFTLQKFSERDQIGHVQIRLVAQTNERSMAGTQYPDGIIYKSASQIQTDHRGYVINILSSDLLTGGWQQNCKYKVQLRFGTTGLYSSLGDFATWKQQQIENQTFSEWSTVMVIKAIPEPQPYIQNAESFKESIVYQDNIEATTTPLFFGGAGIPDEGSVNAEYEDKYRFELYDSNYSIPGYFIESSGWLQHDSVTNTLDTYRFKTRLENDNTYTVVYDILTGNQYQAQASLYTFTVSQNYYTRLEGINLLVESDTVYCQENACAQVNIKVDDPERTLTGCYVITRSSERTNFTVWEDLHYLNLINKKFTSFTTVYTDYTIESGVKYRYALQEENASGLRSAPLYEKDNRDHEVNFYYSYLFRGGLQLRMSFNQKVSSFKHTVLSSKQDTLGDKYPYIAKNGYAYYAEFPITGTISFQMDDDQTFFQLQSDGYYYKDELIIPVNKFDQTQNQIRGPGDAPFIDDTKHLRINSNLTANNIFIERKFREKAEEFLNDYQCKLYKSPTEGNIVVVLTNVSLTPHEQLGRLIFDFSATAYEVMQNNLTNLNDFGIIEIGEFQSNISTVSELSIGQVNGLYKNGQNIYSEIKKQEEATKNLELRGLTAIWIDRYPKDKIISEILDLEGRIKAAEEAGESTEQMQQELDKLKEIQQIIDRPIGTTILKINDQDVIITPNKIYSLHENITSLSIVRSPYPIIVNYVAMRTRTISLSEEVIQSIEVSRIWGQVSGIFTDSSKILRQYVPGYSIETPPYQLIPKTNQQTFFDIYKTENLYNVIEEKVRKEVEKIYGISEGFQKDSKGRWVSGDIFYEFSDMLVFDIEADPNTILWIGQELDGSDKKKVIIGKTGRYTLNPMEEMVRYIALDNDRPQFCIINYKCLTTQMKVVEEFSNV